MTITLLAIGKTDKQELQQLITNYTKRLRRYVPFELDTLPDIRNAKHLSQKEQQDREAEALLKKIPPAAVVYLLDEKGKAYSSEGFAGFIQKQLNSGVRYLVLVIGGPYGFSPKMHERSVGAISLSKMTFSHQMVRLFVAEQLYRAFTILGNEPYHHP